LTKIAQAENYFGVAVVLITSADLLLWLFSTESAFSEAELEKYLLHIHV